MKEKIIKEFESKSKRFYGELEFSPYRMGFGISSRYMTCKKMGWLFRIYLGPFKIWFTINP